MFLRLSLPEGVCQAFFPGPRQTRTNTPHYQNDCAVGRPRNRSWSATPVAPCSDQKNRPRGRQGKKQQRSNQRWSWEALMNDCVRAQQAATQRTIKTGTLQLANTLVATDPTTRLTRAPWPCEPITTRSNFSTSASLAMSSPALPVFHTTLALTPWRSRNLATGFITLWPSSS